ncbi:uncharacterized protein LOC122320314 [Drosophila ficusphila]|uniref:uncharacterized protein LOC122320314 n=1 Tax=Drosophila ficusphila TaxID=30025 RepID=UPI001C89C3AC|nr:uncharacterized protein LOC122320314 [Drosophila ficusphila]
MRREQAATCRRTAGICIEPISSISYVGAKTTGRRNVTTDASHSAGGAEKPAYGMKNAAHKRETTSDPIDLGAPWNRKAEEMQLSTTVLINKWKVKATVDTVATASFISEERTGFRPPGDRRPSAGMGFPHEDWGGDEMRRAQSGNTSKMPQDDQPVKMRYYPKNPKMQGEINEKVNELLQKECIEPSRSPYSSPIVMVKKWRLCVDFRQMNAKSIKDSYPMPMINYILNLLREANYISSPDLKDGYWHIPLEKKSRN